MLTSNAPGGPCAGAPGAARGRAGGPLALASSLEALGGRSRCRFPAEPDRLELEGAGSRRSRPSSPASSGAAARARGVRGH